MGLPVSGVQGGNMADISMCCNQNCPKRSRCYRFMAVPSETQAYSYFEPDLEYNICPAFWEIEKGDIVR